MKTVIKKGTAWMLAALVLTCMIPFQGGAAQYDLNKNTYIDVKRTPTGKTGQNVTLSMIFENKSSEDLHGVSVMFDKDVAEEEYNGEQDSDSENRYTGEVFPFEITSSTFEAKNIGTVRKGSSKTVTLSARVRRDISEGYYTVPLEVKIGGTHAAYDKINIWITKSTSSTEDSDNDGSLRFVMGEDQSTPYGSYPSVMNFSINLRNSGNVTAQNVTVKMVLSEDSTKFPFAINDGNYDRYFERIGGGETVQLPYSMAIRDDVYTGYYPITFKIEYKDSSEGDIQKAEESFYVHVQNKDKEETTGDWSENTSTKARIIVDSFQTIPENVFAGQEFELILRMKNASTNIPASNILFTLKSEEASDKSPVFSTESGSSSIVVNDLGAGQTTELRIKLQSKPGVEQRSYLLTITEKYDSPDFKNATEDVSVSIPLKQEARLNIGTIEVMPDSIAVGSESNVMFGINNTGKVQLYNVMAAFESDSIQKTDTYVGNLEPGKTGNVDVMLSGIAPTADDGKVKITITYEDENGIMKEPVEKELSLIVTEAMDMTGGFDGMDGFDPIDVNSGNGEAGYKKFIIPVAAVILVAAAVIVVILRKKRDKKKAAEEEEEIDDEVS